MSKPNCSFPPCDRQAETLGMCRGHYYQHHRGRSLTALTRRALTPQDRFFQKVADQGDCWVWTGSLSAAGYGTFWSGTRYTTAHKWAYTFFIEDVPPGLELDHLCRRRDCCNPWHLDPVPHAVNCARGTAGWNTHAKALVSTHCRNGHEWTESNTYRIPKTGGRACKECKRLTKARLRIQRQEAQPNA